MRLFKISWTIDISKMISASKIYRIPIHKVYKYLLDTYFFTFFHGFFLLFVLTLPYLARHRPEAGKPARSGGIPGSRPPGGLVGWWDEFLRMNLGKNECVYIYIYMYISLYIYISYVHIYIYISYVHIYIYSIYIKHIYIYIIE